MLRVRLFFGFLPVLLILLAVGVYATWVVSRLAGDKGIVLINNYHSATAVQQMNHAVVHAALAVNSFIEDPQLSGRLEFETQVKDFQRNLQLKLAATSTVEERQLTSEMTTSFEAYREAALGIFAQTNQVMQRIAYRGQIEPRVTILSEYAGRIYTLNDTAMHRAEREIKEMSRVSTVFMALAILMGLIVALYAAFKSSRAILRPIQSLTESARALGEGNLEQAVPVVSNDELGQLAGAFNQMAVQLRVYRTATAEKITRLRNTTEAVLSSFPDPIFVLNRAGEIELHNPATRDFLQSLGLELELPVALDERVRAALQEGVDYLPTQFNEAYNFQVGKEEKYFLPRILAMRQESGALIGVAVVLLDITRFRLLDDVKSNMLATVSHELKTPLTSILMVLHILEEETVGPLNERQVEFTTAARDDAERLLRILNDLLDLSRLESESADLRLESITAEELIGIVLKENRDKVVAQGCQLVAQAEPGLPAVEVDLQRISHVFSNFINNAVKHSPPGARILLRAARHETHSVRFSVKDEGPGIPQEFQARIFERFFRVPGQAKSGAGLGLSIAREIVRAHGGRIGVQSEPGSGSEFFAVLGPVCDVTGA